MPLLEQPTKVAYAPPPIVFRATGHPTIGGLVVSRVAYPNVRRTSAALLSHVARSLLQDEIARSSWIVELGDDWDEAGSPGYAPETLDAAVTILRRLATLQEQRGSFLPVPKILPGLDGIVELRWRSQEWRLLMQVQPSGEATFYGQLTGTSVRGSLPADEQKLLDWIDSAIS